MKCRFNSKITCIKLDKNCLRCSFRDVRTLDGIDTLTPELYVCPFCLTRDKLEAFYRYGKNGNILSTKECWVCGNRMLESTLFFTSQATPKELAVWVYEYPFRDFWKKCKFNTFSANLVKLNIADEFWENYKYLKEHRSIRTD